MGVTMPPPPPAPYPYPPPNTYPPQYTNPHISYTHYNPQFYYMHTTYNYAPPQTTHQQPQQQKTQRLNPEIIKKQRIDNKSCEVIDLCDEKKNILSNITAQSDCNSSLTTPTNLSMDDDDSKDGENKKKINIKSKHSKLFNSLLTPKNSTNSANNSCVIHRMQMMEKLKKNQNDENGQKMNDLFVKMANDLRPINVEKM